jgi:type IV pilus assembly protein PilP
MSIIRFFCGVTVMAALTGCGGDGNFGDLQSYMDEVRARPKGAIEPLPTFQPYEPFTYTAAALRSPFQPSVKIDLMAQQKGSRDVKPDETRIRQFLEGFNIESFEMVGTLSRDGSMYALVRGAGGVHRVKVGDYLGRNHGHIENITPAEIEIVEIVPDGEGGWLQRPRNIPLKERS